MNKSGFTIIELMVVVVIIGLLMGIAGISGKVWMDKARVESQTKEMFSNLMDARVSAMQRSRMHFVTFSPALLAANQYAIYEDTNPAPDGNGTLEPALDRQISQKNIDSLFAVQTGAAQIAFDSNGLVSAGLADGVQTTIRVNGSFGSPYDCIVISLTKIRMGAWNGANCSEQ